NGSDECHQREPGDRCDEPESGPGRRSHGHHDAGNGWIRYDARDPWKSTVPYAPHSRPHCESDEGRSREMPGSGSVRLYRQTGGRQAAALAVARLVAPMIGARRSPATVEASEGTGMPSARRDPVLPVSSSGDETVPILLVHD